MHQFNHLNHPFRHGRPVLAGFVRPPRQLTVVSRFVYVECRRTVIVEGWTRRRPR